MKENKRRSRSSNFDIWSAWSPFCCCDEDGCCFGGDARCFIGATVADAFEACADGGFFFVFLFATGESSSSKSSSSSSSPSSDSSGAKSDSLPPSSSSFSSSSLESIITVFFLFLFASSSSRLVARVGRFAIDDAAFDRLRLFLRAKEIGFSSSSSSSKSTSTSIFSSVLSFSFTVDVVLPVALVASAIISTPFLSSLTLAKEGAFWAPFFLETSPPFVTCFASSSAAIACTFSFSFAKTTPMDSFSSFVFSFSPENDDEICVGFLFSSSPCDNFESSFSPKVF
mmetsp:Transcript_325/g.1090  ORF Transcript_325/g.1090 Transcript_325/m.1090 type:complete len:284 (+) Transcript_325:3152-4003(+)